MNICIHKGRLTKEPEVRRGQSGNAVAMFTVAVDKDYRREGEPTADFLNMKAFGKTAEFIEKYMHKGTAIITQSTLANDNYTNRNGEKVYRDSLIVHRIEFCESRKTANQGGTEKPKAQQSTEDFMHIPDGMTEDMPFN